MLLRLSQNTHIGVNSRKRVHTHPVLKEISCSFYHILLSQMIIIYTAMVFIMTRGDFHSLSVIHFQHLLEIFILMMVLKHISSRKKVMTSQRFIKLKNRLMHSMHFIPVMTSHAFLLVRTDWFIIQPEHYTHFCIILMVYNVVHNAYGNNTNTCVPSILSQISTITSFVQFCAVHMP